jgi:ABC-2 type transport system ATP-binding protein
MCMTYTIELDQITKSYGDTPVLKALDLLVPAGSVFALLGPNGAGKTTVIRILATLLKADGGSARIAGHDVVSDRSEVRRRIGLVGQYAALDELATGEENLTTIGRLRGLRPAAARRRTGELLGTFDLTDAGRRRLATYSGGMRRRLDLAASLVGRPEVLFLDEPSTGLDPRSRRALWEVISDMTRSGVTVLLTTQYLEEADQLADEVAVIDRGRIVAQGSPENLKQRVAGRRLLLTVADLAAFQAVSEVVGERATQLNQQELTIAVATEGDASEVRALLDEVDPDRVNVERFVVESATLDDVFLALTGHATDERHATDESQPEPEAAHV